MERLRQQLRNAKSCYFLEENENAVEKEQVQQNPDAGSSVQNAVQKQTDAGSSVEKAEQKQTGAGSSGENAVQKGQVEKKVEKERPNAVQTSVDMKEDAAVENVAVQQPPSKKPRWRNLEPPAVEGGESHGSLSQDTLPWDSSVMEDTDEA